MERLYQPINKLAPADHPNIESNIQIHQKQTDQIYDQLLLRFNTIIGQITNDPKIEQYMQRIQVSAKEVSDNFRAILKSCQQLKQKKNKSEIIFRAALKIFRFLLQFLKTKNIDDLDSKGKTVWFLEIQTKLHCSLQFFHSFKEHSDVTNSLPAAYPEVWAKIKIDKPNDTKSLKKQYKSLKKMLHVATSASINEQKHDLCFIRKCRFGLSFSRLMIMNDSAKLRSYVFYRNPTLKMAQKIWNLPEQGATKQFLKILYEGVKVNRKIYLPTNEPITNKTDIFTQNETAITVRILSNKKIRIFNEPETCSCCQSVEEQIKFFDTVLLHMHGGGFVALSSRSMQNYTRRWTKELNIPVLSIDYRMPPDHPFPTAPQDCLLVYRFLIEQIHNFMNIKPTQIYLAGESAGGNLVCSLTGLILKNKLPIPKALYMAYPATDLRMIFSESRLYSITDPLLWPSMLLLCLKSYLKGDLKKAQNPLVSPSLLSQEYINGTIGDNRFPLQWPKTFITAGMKDPLLDDSLILMQRMTESNIDCACVIYQQLSHGYLNLDMLVKQCQKTLDHSIQHLKELIRSTRTL